MLISCFEQKTIKKHTMFTTISLGSAQVLLEKLADQKKVGMCTLQRLKIFDPRKVVNY